MGKKSRTQTENDIDKKRQPEDCKKKMCLAFTKNLFYQKIIPFY